MGQQTEALAAFAAGLQWDDIPQVVQRHARLVVLDTLGVILAGSARPEVHELRVRLAADAAGSATILAAGWPTSDPRSAALVNGIAARSLELNEGHRFVMFQGGAQILPGLVATGERLHGSGRDLLCSLVAGYDVGVRLALAMTPRPLAHQNGQATMLGAVAGASRLRGFDARTLDLALRIGATLMLTPSYTGAVAGATSLNVAGGMCGVAASLAPELALSGFEARTDAVEQALGQLVGDGFDPELLLQDLGSRWEITRNWFRLRACCNPAYPALDALEAALAVLRPAPEDIERIEIATYRFASHMREQDPPNYFASKYSLPHAAAGLALKGDTGFATLDEASVRDPAFSAMRHRVTVTEDPAMTAALPDQKQARATVVLKDGRQSTGVCDNPRGDFLHPYGEAEIRGKFHQLSAATLTASGATRVEDAIDRLDHMADVAELITLLRGAAR